MKTFYRLAGAALLFALFASPALAAGDEVPAWLRQAAAAPAPAYEKDVPAVVLHKEKQLAVGADGRVVTTETYAVRVLTGAGREHAFAAVPYITDGGKVRELRAWLLRPAGPVKRYGKDETTDMAAEPNDVYNESRVKLISAKDEAEAGAVFGYEAVSEERSIFNEDGYLFQDSLPALVSRYTLALPQGWRASDVTFNREKIAPVVSGSTYTWELRGLAPIPQEPMSPSWRNIAPRLAVSYFPSEGKGPGTFRNFADWAEVSRMVTTLTDPSADSNDALATKAMQLAAGAKTELEKIRAVAAYVQSVQYISIDVNVNRGGGIRPRPATLVFARNYGDCKDKANLMRAMLRALGIQSYLVAIYSGDPNFVRAEWASPFQFNHCIIAVRVSDETKAPTVVEHPKLGRLLVFDATDEVTPVGDLPDHEQGSLALVMGGDEGSLVRMPTTPPEANRLERTAEITLSADGSISAALRESSQGQSAVNERRIFRGRSRPEYAGVIEGWITRGATGAKVTKIEPADDAATGRFSLDVEFGVSGYGQLMQGRLLVFKPAVVSRREGHNLTAPSRRHPVVVEPSSYAETVRVKLPAGFDVDEMPDPVKLDAPFGSYRTTYEVRDGRLHFTRSFTQRAATIPADQYAQVRSFFESIRAAEQAPVVLVKK